MSHRTQSILDHAGVHKDVCRLQTKHLQALPDKILAPLLHNVVKDAKSHARKEAESGSRKARLQTAAQRLADEVARRQREAMP